MFLTLKFDVAFFVEPFLRRHCDCEPEVATPALVPAEADGDATWVALVAEPDPDPPVAVADAPSAGKVALALAGGVIPAEVAARFETGGPGNT